MFMFKKMKGVVWFCFFYLSISFAMATSLNRETLRLGHAAYLNDTNYSAGPTSSQTNDPGQWASSIVNFNQRALQGKEITRLYVYSGSIVWNCTSPSDCVFSGAFKNVFVNYASPEGYGEASVAAYRAQFPELGIFAVFDYDGRVDFGGPITYVEVATETADLVADTICADPNVDGVVLDIPEFVPNAEGQRAFYTRLAYDFLSPACRDANHPLGRKMGVVTRLQDADTWNWSIVSYILQSSGFLIIPGYGLHGGSVALGISTYAQLLLEKINLINGASGANGIKYTIMSPAAAGTSEFSAAGDYQPSTPPCDFVSHVGGQPQLDYIMAARTNILASATSSNYLGTDYWGWSQFKTRHASENTLLYPCTPDDAPGVIKYLQQHGY